MAGYHQGALLLLLLSGIGVSAGSGCKYGLLKAGVKVGGIGEVRVGVGVRDSELLLVSLRQGSAEF